MANATTLTHVRQVGPLATLVVSVLTAVSLLLDPATNPVAEQSTAVVDVETAKVERTKSLLPEAMALELFATHFEEREQIDPFRQLSLVGLDGEGLRRDVKRMALDVASVEAIDLTRIDAMKMDQDERRCLTQAIYYEARNQSLAGQLAVADVVLNRVAHKRYPSTICGVVFQGSHRHTGCQFSFTCDGSMDARIEVGPMLKSRILATAVMGGFRLPVSGEATNYHAEYVEPYWAPTLDVTARIDDHVFYKRGQNFRLAMAGSAD